MENSYYISLGQRVRRRRQKLKITQAELCGDKITRNMLSQIENGNARPSLETLLFIAEKLSVSPSYLVCTNEQDEALYRRIDSVGEIRRLYSSGQVEKCAALCRTIEARDDEITMLLSRCELEIALKLFRSSRLQSSLSHINEAEKLSVGLAYFSHRISSSAKLLRLLIRSVTSGIMPDPSEISALHGAFYDDDSFLYLLALTLSEKGDSSCCSSFIPLVNNPIYKKYLEARLLMANDCHAEALPLLRSAAHSESADCFTEYFALADLEECLQKCDIYKEAYECAKRRMVLPDRYGE